MINNTQGLYAPLPQSFSDSDSDKDHEPNQINFPGDKIQNGEAKHNGYIISDHFISRVKPGWAGMSFVRKTAFVISIIIVFKVVVGFLFLLPCNMFESCPITIRNWKNVHEGLEFMGKINVLFDKYSQVKYLGIIGKKEINSDCTSGVMGLKASNGAIGWINYQPETPSKLFCDLIDVNGDSVNDCLTWGVLGLEAIDSTRGASIWHVHSHGTLVTHMDFPKILPDLNSDGIRELITVRNFNSYHNKILVICGRTGSILYEFTAKACIEVSDFKYEDKMFIYLCQNGTVKSYYKFGLKDLQAKAKTKGFPMKPMRIEYSPLKEELCVLNEHELSFENFGNCPICNATFRIYKEKKLVWERLYKNAFSMHPVGFTFKETRSNIERLQGHIKGFAVKLWLWNGGSTGSHNNISENIILITLNDTKIEPINVSYTPIVQICDSYSCQPDLLNHQDSLTICDLDHDDSKELISYYTTYDCEGGMEKCKLVSNIEVVRLEAELPKFYAN